MSFMCWAAKSLPSRRAARCPRSLSCFEKQSNWGGLWNYSWRTGTDENGEPVAREHVQVLWSNGPKESALSFHFPRSITNDLFRPLSTKRGPLTIQGRWKKEDLKRFNQHFSTIVKDVATRRKTTRWWSRT